MTNKKDQLNNSIERRFFDIKVELRKKEDEKESRTIVGHGAIFEKMSLPLGWGGWFREKISKDAFAEADMSNVLALFNHDSNIPFARTPDTLKLEIDEIGLRYEFEAPNTTAGNDLLELVKAGIIYQSSFAFDVKKMSWEITKDPDYPSVEEIRTIEKIGKLYDVSPVTNPAYPDADVAQRTYDEIKAARQIENTTEKQNAELEREQRLRLFDYQSKLL